MRLAYIGVRYVTVTADNSIGCGAYKFNCSIILLAADRWYYCELGRGATPLSLSRTIQPCRLGMRVADNFAS